MSRRRDPAHRLARLRPLRSFLHPRIRGGDKPSRDHPARSQRLDGLRPGGPDEIRLRHAPRRVARVSNDRSAGQRGARHLRHKDPQIHPAAGACEPSRVLIDELQRGVPGGETELGDVFTISCRSCTGVVCSS
jgi:hypothetical protein